MRTTGIIGGMTWKASLEYYRLMNQLVSERLGGTHSAKLILWSVDFDEHVAIHERGGWEALAGEIIEIARRLKSSGADFLVMAVNTIHRVADQVEKAAGLPLLHIADAAAEGIKAAGMKRVGLLGTRHTMTEDFYRVRLRERHGIEVLIPGVEDREAVDRIIYEELARGRFEEPSRRVCLEVIDRLNADGAEGVVLGCTELPLLIMPEHTDVRLFDTLALHVRAAVDYALSA